MSAEPGFTTLANGLRVVTERLPSVRTAAAGIWVDVGARYEPLASNGVAHFLEHMAFKGTGSRSAREIAETIENVGGSLNAYTSREHTAFYARTLAADLPLSLDLVADILTDPTFADEEMEKERHVIVQEIGEVQDSPADLLFDLFQEEAYPGQAMGRSILGPEEVVLRLGAGDMRGWMASHYHPNRMVLAASGEVDHAAIVAQAERLFGHLPRGPEPVAERARYQGGSLLDGRDLEQAHVCFGIEALGWDDPDFFAWSVLSTALGGGMSSRLFQEVRESRGLCYSIGSFAWSFAETGLFGIEAGTGAEDVEELAEVVARETRSLVLEPREAEVARAKAQLEASTLMALESCYAVTDDLSRQLLCHGRRIPTDETVARIRAVDVKAVAAVGRRLLGSGAASTVVALGPLKRLPGMELGRLAG